jgi:tyrosine decarboxylase/aspartate 1-decarboxylase
MMHTHITKHNTKELFELQVNGETQEALLKELSNRLKGDFTYNSGRVIGSMCTSPHAIAREAYVRFLETNLGDSGLFPAVRQMEKETIQMMGSMLSNSNASGHILTGGTEANIMAMWTAKKLAKKNKGEIIMSSSAHFSFDKAAELLCLKPVRIKLNSQFQVEASLVEEAVNPNTVAVVGMAGTTGLGVVDPIDELSEISLKNNLHLHVDAAFGGFVLPFLRDLGYAVPNFDFAVEGVRSIAVDPHKMGLAVVPAGGLLYRKESLRKATSWKVTYLSGGEAENATLVGTRSGASALAVWAVMKHLGRKGYTRIIEECMRLTKKLADEIPKIEGLDIMTQPTMNIIGLRSSKFSLQKIAQELRTRKWAVALFPHHIRIVVMPHVKEEHVQELLQDLNQIANKLRT